MASTVIVQDQHGVSTNHDIIRGITVSVWTDLQFRDARGQHHGEESDEEVAVLPQRQVRLAAQLLETKHGDTHPASNELPWNGKQYRIQSPLAANFPKQ